MKGGEICPETHRGSTNSHVGLAKTVTGQLIADKSSWGCRNSGFSTEAETVGVRTQKN